MIECLLECFNECINYCWYNRFLIDVLIRALIRLQSFRCESTINTNFLFQYEIIAITSLLLALVEIRNLR